MTPIFVVTLQDVIGLTLLGIMLLFWIGYYSKIAIKQALCKHNEGVNETRSCDAICRKCGKDLGFIGSWREQEQKSRKE